MTKQKELIKKIIVTSEKHLSAEEIFMLAKKEMPKIAFGTVYRNLNILVGDKEIKRIDVSNGVSHYDKNTIHHEHVVCQNCGSVEDIMEIDLTEVLSRVQEKYHITGYNFTAQHICDECKNNIDN